MQVRKEPNSAELQSPGRQTRAFLHPGAPCFAQPRAVWEHLQTPEPVVQTPWTRSVFSAGWLTSHPYTAALWRATSSTSKLLILLSFHAAQSPNWFSSSSFPHVQPQTLQVQTNGGSLEGSKESTQRPAKHNLMGKKNCLEELDLSSLEIRRQKRLGSSLQLHKRLLQRVWE